MRPRGRRLPRARAGGERPVLPAGVTERFLPVVGASVGEATILYRPALLAVASLHYALAKHDVDAWAKCAWLAPLDDAAATPWEAGREIGTAAPDTTTDPVASARFAALPSAAARAESYERWRKSFATHLYRERPLVLWTTGKPAITSRPGESEGAFRVRLRDAAHESRDAAVEKLRAKHAPALASLRDRIERSEQRVEIEKEQYGAKKMETAISIGASVVGALFGRKLASRVNVGRAASVARGIGRASDERGDVARAGEKLDQLRAQLAELEGRCEADIAALEQDIANRAGATLEELRIPPRKTDLDVESIVLTWTPWRVAADGSATPA